MKEQENQLSVEETAAQLFVKFQERYYLGARKHLQQEIRQCSEQIKGNVDRVKDVDGYAQSSMLKQFSDQTLSTAVQINQLSEGLDQPFMLFVMGMGNYGKSTLLNALLEQNAAEVDFLPKTWKIDVFRGDNSSKSAVVRYKDGSTKLMNIQECKKFLEYEEKKREESVKKANEEFKRQAAVLKTIEEKEEMKKLIYNKMLYKSNVIEVQWPVKPNDLSKDFRLVDTPGLVQDLVGEVKFSIQEYYHKADGVLWLLDATAISAQKSRRLLDELNEALSQVGGRSTNMIGVLNSIDRVRKTGGEEAVNAVVAEANRLFGDIFQEIIPISAKEAYDGFMTNNQEMLERSGIKQLLDAVRNRFLNKAQIIQTESKVLGLKNVCNSLYKSLDDYHIRYLKDSSSFERISDDFDKAFDQLIKKVEDSNSHFLSNYHNRVLNNIERYAEQLFDYSDQNRQKAFIQSNIFETDALQSELKKFQVKITDMFKQFYQFHSSKSVFKEYEHLSINKLPVALQNEQQFLVKTDTLDMDTFGVSLVSGAGMFIAGAMVLGPIGLVLAGIASALGLAKWIAVKMKLPGLKDDLRNSLDEYAETIEENILNSLNPQLEVMYNKVEEIRNDTFAALHADYDSKESIIESIKQLKEKSKNPVKQFELKNLLLSS